MRTKLPILASLLVTWTACAHAEVSFQRVPDGGIQPQTQTDAAGNLHLIYYKGDPSNGDVFYAKSTDGGTTFSQSLKVNSVPGSAIAMGNVRGAQLAIGKDARAHVAWMGSANAAPRGPAKESPMLYARLNDAGDAFEAQRNVITTHYGLDGGGTISADPSGNVYVLWHGKGDTPGEEFRRVWMTHSSDNGVKFTPEKAVTENPTGACACCGMKAFADSAGGITVLYREAEKKTNRGIVMLISTDHGAKFQGGALDKWDIGTCPMSTASIAQKPLGAGTGPVSISAAWENNGQIFFSTSKDQTKRPSMPQAAPGLGQGRKHPVTAVNAKGETLLTWTEGMGWARGGKLVWQMYDAEGRPTKEAGSKPGVPVWSLLAAAAKPDGTFVILY